MTKSGRLWFAYNASAQYFSAVTPRRVDKDCSVIRKENSKLAGNTLDMRIHPKYQRPYPDWCAVSKHE